MNTQKHIRPARIGEGLEKKRGSKLFILLLSAILIMQSFYTMPAISFAEGEDSQAAIKIDAEVQGLPVSLSFSGKTDSGKTDSNGVFESGELYRYLSSLGWDGADAEGREEVVPPSVTSVKVDYKLNNPDAKTPEERESAGGRIDYKGASGSFTINYDSNGDWKNKVSIPAPDKEKVFSSFLKLIPFGKSTDDATAVNGVQVTLTDGSSQKSSETGKDGSFTFYGYDKNDEDVKLSVTATSKYPAEETTIGKTKAAFYLKGRPSVSERDYNIPGAHNNYVARPQAEKEYIVTGTGDNLLALTRDGKASEQITVTVSPNGNVTPFYVEKYGVCSEKVENAIKIDETAPELTDIDTKAVDGVRIKKHGIYTKQKAELLITVTVTEKESGLDKLNLVGKNSDGNTYYDTYKVEESGNTTKATFIIESQKELLTQVLYLTSSDKVGNKSKDVLLRGSEDPSTITMEIIPPIIDDIEITKGTINENGWYHEPLKLSVGTTDAESGLSDVEITTNNSKTIYKAEYEEKETVKKTAEFELSEENIRKEKNDNGEYKILVKASDNSGNLTAKSITVKVDLDAPVLSMTGVEKGEYRKTSPVISISEDEEYFTAEGNHITVNVKKDGKAHYEKTFSKVNKCRIPTSVFAGDGDYSIRITCADAAGNKAESISTYFVKDSTAPVVTIFGPDGGKYYNKVQTSTIQVRERNYDTNDVKITVTKTLDGKTVKVPFPWKNKAPITKFSKAFKDTGTYKISVYAIDKAGNKSATKTANFTVDTVAPELTISGIAEGKIYSYKDIIAPNITFSDDYLEGRTVTLTKAGTDWYGRLAKSESKGSIKFSDFQKVKVNDGIYALAITVSDKAGNSTKKTVNFTVNRFGSAFKYNNAIKKLNGKSVQNIDEDLVITEVNVSELKETQNELKLDGSDIDVDGKAKTSNRGKKNGYNTYTHTYPSDLFSSEGVYEVNVISEDEAGNNMESKKENGKVKITVDRTSPTLRVSGYEKYNRAETITLNIATSDNLSNPSVAATVNGSSVEISKDKQGGYALVLNEGSGQEVEITATDGAGNTETFSERISVIPNGILFFLMKYKLPICGGVILLTVGAATLIVLTKKRKKKEDDVL